MHILDPTKQQHKGKIGKMWKGFSSSAPTITLQALTDEMEALSEKDRKKIRDDLFGKTEPVDESDSMLEKGFQAMASEMELIPREEKVHYMAASEQCPDYVQNRDFLVCFLRSESFDAKVCILQCPNSHTIFAANDPICIADCFTC